MNQQTLLVAFGGVSPEHEVSVITGIQAALALKEQGKTVLPLYINKQGNWLTGEALLDLSSFKSEAEISQKSKICRFRSTAKNEVVFEIEESGFLKKNTWLQIESVLCAFHGSDGENGSFQGLCEQFNIPYTGSGVLASALGMDKDLTKRVCRDAAIPVVPGISFTESIWAKQKSVILSEIAQLNYPIFVKPARLGSSIGVSKAKNEQELINAIETGFRYDSKLVVEKAVQPLREINCSVLGTPDENRASVCEQPKGSTEVLSFKDKYQSDAGNSKGMASASRIIPAPISDEQTQKIQELSCKIFSLLGCSGVARLDFLINDESGEIYFNEINTIPGSLSFYLWEKSNLSFKQLVNELIQISKIMYRMKNGRIRSYETNLLQEKSVKGLKGLKGLKG